MVERSRFWNATTVGDATEAPYDAPDEFSEVLRSVAGAAGITVYLSGVFRSELNQLIGSGTATPFVIGTGRALTHGEWYEADVAVSTVIPSPAGATRIDRIVLRKDWVAQTVRITRIAGVEGGSAPPLVNIDGVTWDQPLYELSITTGGVITATDLRSFIGGSPFSGLSTFAVGDMLYANTTTTFARLALGAAGTILTVAPGATAPSWSAVISAGTDASSSLSIGSGGTATGARSATLILNVPTAGGFEGQAAIAFRRNGGEVWNAGISAVAAGGALTANTNLYFHTSVGNIYRMALTTAGNLRLFGDGEMLGANAETGTGSIHHRLSNTGGNAYVVIDNSAGTGLIAGGPAYALNIWHDSARSMVFGTNNLRRMFIAASTSAVSIGNTAGAASTINFSNTYDGANGYAGTYTGLSLVGPSSTVRATLQARTDLTAVLFGSETAHDVSFITGNTGKWRLASGGSLLAESDYFIGRNTADASDSGYLVIGGGGAAVNTRGAYIELYGNDHASAGLINIVAGDAASGRINFTTHAGGTTVRWTINSSGHINAGIDNAFDIGADAALRPRNVFIAGSLILGTGPSATGIIRLPNESLISFRNAAGTGDIAGIGLNNANTLNIGSGGPANATYSTAAAGTHAFYVNFAAEIVVGGGLQVGVPAGGAKGVGTINVTGDIYKNNSAYTNPDYAFEHFFTNSINKFKNNVGAKDYPGLLTLKEVETFVRENFHLPMRFSREEGIGIYDRADFVLEKVEELYLYLFDIEKRLSTNAMKG